MKYEKIHIERKEVEKSEIKRGIFQIFINNERKSEIREAGGKGDTQCVTLSLQKFRQKLQLNCFLTEKKSNKEEVDISRIRETTIR